MKRVFLKCANSPQERISRMGSKESRGDTEGDLASVQSSQSQRFFSEVWFFFKSYSDFHQNSVWNFSSYDFFSRKKWPFWSRQPHFLSRLLESLELLLTITMKAFYLECTGLSTIQTIAFEWIQFYTNNLRHYCSCWQSKISKYVSRYNEDIKANQERTLAFVLCWQLN